MKKRPIVLCIMDGYGISESINGNAVRFNGYVSKHNYFS